MTETRIRRLLAAALGLSGLALGLTHVHDVAYEHGQKGPAGWQAWAVAVTIELVVLVAALHIKAALRAKTSVLPPALYGGAGFAFSMVCQVVDAPRTVLGWLVAAAPVLFFLGAAELEMGHLRLTPAQPAAPAVAQPVRNRAAQPRPAVTQIAQPTAQPVAQPQEPVAQPAQEPLRSVEKVLSQSTKARLKALDHLTEHGELPTAGVLAAASGVSRGTCTTVLRELRKPRSVPNEESA